MSAADAKRASDQTAVNDKFTALETVRQGDLQDAEEKRRLASEAVEARFSAVDEQQAASTTATEELSKRLADVETVAVLADETNAAQDERLSTLATETDAKLTAAQEQAAAAAAAQEQATTERFEGFENQKRVQVPKRTKPSATSRRPPKRNKGRKPWRLDSRPWTRHAPQRTPRTAKPSTNGSLSSMLTSRRSKRRRTPSTSAGGSRRTLSSKS